MSGNNKNKELRNKIKKLAWEHLGKKVIFPQEISWEDYIIGNLDRPQYLIERFGKHGITEEIIQKCYQKIGDELATNPNVIAQVAELVATVRNYLAERVGRPISNEEIKPVTEALGKLTISLLIEKNIEWIREDYERQE